MDKYLSLVSTKLKDLDIVLDESSISSHKTQGFMSRVYVANSSQGRLIIHIGQVSFEQKRQIVWEKIEALSNLLFDKNDIPVAKIFYSESIDNHYFLVQEMLPGEVAGTRKIVKNKVIDTWYNNSTNLKNNIENIIYSINNINIKGYGRLYVDNGEVYGKHTSWVDFLDKEINLWCGHIAKLESKTGLDKKLKEYFDGIKHELLIDNSYLIHGDLTSPSNILINGDKVTGLVDWEWSLSGDPAWEFAFNNTYSLDNYLSKTKYNSKLFRRKIKYYNIIYLIWGLYLHSMPKDRIYVSLKQHLSDLGF